MKLKHSLSLKLKFLAIYQILSAACGLFVIILFLLQNFMISGQNILILLLMIMVHCIAIVAGLKLLRKKYKKGLILSCINQCLQVLAFSVGSFEFMYFAGIKMFVQVGFYENLEFTFGLRFLSQFNLHIFSNTGYYFSINLFAIFLLWFIANVYDYLLKKNKTTPNS